MTVRTGSLYDFGIGAKKAIFRPTSRHLPTRKIREEVVALVLTLGIQSCPPATSCYP